MMTDAIKLQIVEAEDRLRQAMLASDVNILDELISPDIIITNHFGQLMSKEDDLAAHRSGVFVINELNPSEQRIQIHGEVAIASVRMQLSGSYAGNPTNGDFRFTRVWSLIDGEWRIIAAHIGQVV